MIFVQISGYILICLMIRIVYLATKYVSEAEYKQKGIYHITINAWFRGNKTYKEWLRRHKDYHWCILFILLLCLIALILIDLFRRRELLIMPEPSIILNILLCISIFKAQFWFTKRLKR